MCQTTQILPDSSSIQVMFEDTGLSAVMVSGNDSVCGVKSQPSEETPLPDPRATAASCV